MPVSNDTFTRIWKFVDQYAQGDNITRSALDAALDDLAEGVNAALAGDGAALTAAAEAAAAAAAQAYVDDATDAKGAASASATEAAESAGAAEGHSSDASDAAGEAAASAATAENAAEAAQKQASDAEIAAQTSVTAKDAAEVAQAMAEAARDAAAIGAQGVYPTVSAGLAATSDGERFILAASDGWSLYENQSGVEAQVSGSFPSLATLRDEIDDKIRLTQVRQDRPGEILARYTSSKSGGRDGPPVSGRVVAAGDQGRVLEIPHGTVVALRDRIWIDASRPLTVRAVFRVLNNSCDPEGEPVFVGIEFLDQDYASVGAATLHDAVVAESDGWIDVSALLGADVAPPSGAVYAVPYLEVGGTDGDWQVAQLGVEVEPATVPNIPPEKLPNIPVEKLPNIPIDILPPEVGASEPVARTIYVKENGSDSRTGSSLDEAVQTVERAAELASDIDGVSEVVIAAGNYVVPPDTEVQPRALIRGTSERAVTLSLPDGQEESIMFRMQDGSMLESFTAANIRHDAYTFDPVNGVYIPPTTGFVCALKDGANIKRLPYMKTVPCRPAVADDFAAMTAPLDRLGGNPDVQRGAGGMLIDGDAFGPYSQQRGMCAFAATQVAPNGIAMLVKGNAFTQAVSVYSNFNRLSVWCVDGAEATFKNGDATFGDYTFAATGFRAYIQIPDDAFAAPGENDTAAAAIDNNEAAILADAETRWAQRSWWGSLSSDQRDLTRRDAGLLVRAIANDLRSGQTKGAQQFVKGLFDGEAQYVFPASLLNAFLESFEDIEDAIVSVTSISAGPVGQLMTVVTTVLNDPASYRKNTGSFIYAEPQGMSYAGQGVNLRALPPELGGVGVPIFPDETIVEANGGRVEIKWSANTGESRLARGLYVDENGRVYGEEFERFVQAVTLPQVFAFGG